MENLTTTQKIAKLMQELNIGELIAVYDLAFDLKHALQKIENQKIRLTQQEEVR